MGTIKQKELAKAIVENAKSKEKLNKGELVEMGGYSKTVAEAKPGEIIGQKGVQEELEKLGFDEESAKKVVKSIMLSEKVDPQARLKATDQVFKVFGSYAPEKRVELGLLQTVEISEEAAKKYVKDNLQGLITASFVESTDDFSDNMDYGQQDSE